MISVLTKNNGEHSEHVTVALMFNNTDAERTRDPSRNILTGSRTGISHHGASIAHTAQIWSCAMAYVENINFRSRTCWLLTHSSFPLTVTITVTNMHERKKK